MLETEKKKKNYNQQIQNLNLGNFVEFVGYVNEDMKYNLIQKSDLLVVPSVESNFGDIEGMPVVILEGLFIVKHQFLPLNTLMQQKLLLIRLMDSLSKI